MTMMMKVSHLMAPVSRRLYLVARGLLGELCGLIGAEAQRIEDLALRCAAKDRVVDAADQVLDSHRDARGARDARHNRRLERKGSRGDGKHG